MLATISRHSLRSLALAFVPAVVIVGTVTIVMAPESAWAQAVNVRSFECNNQGELDVDIRGLGTLDVCIEGTITVETFCACATRSGNCPNAANKRTSEETETASVRRRPENGRVNVDLDADEFFGDVIPDPTKPPNCATLPTSPLICPQGQTETAIGFDTSGGTFVACTEFTTNAAGECACTGETIAGPVTCPEGGVTDTFGDPDEDCVALFPELE
jgi:hypothetical protein